MRKNATKIAAMVLSLALTVTSVNVPTTSSAAAKVKLNKTKATLTVGKTTKLVAKVNGKKVKATFTSSNAKVAKVAKTTGKVTAKKAGTAKITAKYNGKKAVCKVTVKAKATPTVEPTVAPTVEPTVAPTAEPTVEPTMEPTMPPVVKKEAAKIEATLVNPFDAAHIDTVLIGTNAEIKVKVTDEDGNPVAGETVVMTEKRIDNTNTVFGLQSDSVVTTNEKGQAIFVYGTYSSSVKPTRTDLVTHAELTVNVAGTGVKTTTNLKFAAIELADLNVKNEDDQWDAYPNPVPGTNKVPGTVEWYHQVAAVSSTTAAQNIIAEYVNSNQVSASDADHSITLSSGAYLVMPEVENKNTASEIAVPVNFSSGSYGVYTDGGATYFEKVIEAADASELQYATVNFDSINLSEHTQMEVNAYVVKHPNDPWGDINWNMWRKWAVQLDLDATSDAMTKIYKGKMDVTNKSLQIPLNVDEGYYLFVTAKIVSKGQVDTDNNKGFVLRDIVGVYNNTEYNADRVREPLSGVTIDWAKNENAMYEVPVTLDGKDTWTKNVYTYLDGQYNADIADTSKQYTFAYSVPAFPYTGNAVITVYDANKKAVAYWAKPTTNDSNNVNIFANTGTDDLYQISEAEANNRNVGSVTTDADGNAKVDSTATGVTHVIGTITSTNPNVVIDASNNKLYSSVQWNPIPNAVASAVRKPAAALAGQTITVNAQLADRNGNPVKTSGVSVAFMYDKTEIKADDVLAGDKDYNFGTTVDVIACDAKTDATGKAKLVLTAANAAILTGLTAEVTEQGSAYKLAYTLGGETVVANCVDLYWLDANIGFTPYVGADEIATDKVNPYVDATGIMPAAGTNWEYGVYPMGTKSNNPWYLPEDGALGAYYPDAISGLTVFTTVGDDSKGTVTNAANGKANATSKQAGLTFLENVIDSSSVSNNMSVTFHHKDDWNNMITLPIIGEGTPNIDKKLTLNVNWGATDTTASIIIPTGTKGIVGKDKTVYVKVSDAFGNMVEGAKVTITGATTTEGTTDSNGIATFTVPAADAAGKSTTVVAKVEGVDNLVVSKSIKWYDAPAAEKALKIESAEYDFDTHVVTVTFNKAIEKASVVADMFTVTYGDGTDAKVQIVKNLSVVGKKITFTLPALTNVDKTTAFNLAIDEKAVDGITYTLTATDGETVTTTMSPAALTDNPNSNISVK